MKIVILEDDYIQSDTLRQKLIDSWPEIDVEIIETESDFLSRMPYFVEQVPSLFIVDMMLPWAYSNVDTPVSPEHVSTEGYLRAGIRCVNSLLKEPVMNDVPIILYTVLHRSKFSFETQSFPNNVIFLSKETEIKYLLQCISSFLAVRHPRKSPTLLGDVNNPQMIVDSQCLQPVGLQNAKNHMSIIHEPETVGAVIFTALPKELNAVLKALPGFERVQTSTRRVVYRTTTPKGCKLVLASMASMGNVESAMLASDVLKDFKPARAILTGIAGSLSNEVVLGDVVVSEQVVDYEIAKIRDEDVERRWSVYRNDSIFLERAKQYQDTSWHNLILAKPPVPPTTSLYPRVHFGIVMSGNKVIASKAAATEFTSFWRKALAVEMEGVGIGAVVQRQEPSIPFVVVKGVCDRADVSKADDWQEFAAASAAAYTISLLQNIFGPLDNPISDTANDKSCLPGTHIPNQAFRLLVAERYNTSDLKALAFDIDVEWDEIPGVTKTEKIVELVGTVKENCALRS